MVPGWIVIVSFTIATIGATVEKVSTMPNRRRMMFCGFEKICFYPVISIHRNVRSFPKTWMPFVTADAICNTRAPHACTAPSQVSVRFT